MNKDVIYIDIEDDITAIIGKVKAAGHNIVALVPPKRVGVLQSAVNLKLLQKAASSVDKRIVLISSDHSLLTLAAGLKLPVARNLQSRPEIPDLPEPEVSHEEVINGAELPIGEVASAMGVGAAAGAAGAAGAGAAANKPDAEVLHQPMPDSVAGKPAAKPLPETLARLPLIDKLHSKGKLKVPNFDIFRKRLFIFGTLGVALIAFLIWANVIAPHLTVTISAKTIAVNIDRGLKLNPSADTDLSKLTFKPVVEQIKKSVATEFDATGKKAIGDKASGSITVRNCDYTDGALVLDKGTKFTGDNGKVYVSTQAVTVEGYTGLPSFCTLEGPNSGKTDVPVEAQKLGPDYNVGGQHYDVDRAGNIDGIDSEGMSGGTKEIVTVVSQKDIDNAKDALVTQDEDAVKEELKQQFNAEEVLIIEESFEADSAAPSSSPGLNEEAKSAKLTLETTYTYIALRRDEVRELLQNALNQTLKDKPDQQIYTLGESNIQFQNFQKAAGGKFTTTLVTTGSIGPKIDTNVLAGQLVNKRFGEIEDIANQIPGVDNIDIKFSPFWVSSVGSTDKIEIKFSVSPNEQ